MKIWLVAGILSLFIILFLVPAGAQEATQKGNWLDKAVPEKYRELVEESLELAGENIGQIEDFLKNTPPGQQEAASFLVAYMAPGDLACASPEALREHLDYALATRDLLPWSKKVTKELFHHHVLPCRVTQEPFEQWRKYLFERVYPRIKHFETMEDVALEINRWCKERFTYKPTQRRDQGIFENLKRGVGRCEEMMILYICAARSVGIPTRACSCPLWSTCDSNHAWVEVWCDGKWYYLGACEPADSLDAAWFTGPARRAPLVVSRIYGVPEDTKTLYRVYKRSAVINSTSVYAETGKVALDTGIGAEVYFYVFNYGSLRPFAKREAGDEGKVEIELGPGEYIFTISANDKVAKWGKVKVQPPEESVVEYGAGPAPKGYMWLRYPKKPKRKKGSKSKDEKKRKPLPDFEVPPDIYKVKHFKPEDYPEVMEKIKDNKLKDKAVEALKKSLGNCNSLTEAIRCAWEDDLDDLLYLITELPVLDLIEATPETLFMHIGFAKTARLHWPKLYDKETWREYILIPRTGYEPLGNWRDKLYWRFHKLMGPAQQKMRRDHWIGPDPVLTALKVNKWLGENVKEMERTYGGSWKDPLLVVKSRCGRKGEINGCAIGILRAIGIPAKLSKNKKWVEFYDGKEWQPLYPLDPDNFGNKQKSPEAAKEYEKPGTLVVSFKRKGRPLAKFSHFATIKLDGKYWSTQWPEDETDDKGMARLQLAPGEYLFNAGVRNRNGDPYIFFTRIKIESEKELQLEVALDMPLEQLSREDLVVRQLKKMPDIKMQQVYPAHERAGLSYYLYVFFTLDNEPCKSMLPRINDFAGKAGDLKTFYIYLGSDTETFKAFAKEHNLFQGDRLLYTADPAEAIKKLKLPNKDGKLKAMPSVMMVEAESGKIFYWEEGFNLAIDQTLNQVLDMMRREK